MYVILLKLVSGGECGFLKFIKNDIMFIMLYECLIK